jgi:hypothetical protein
MSGTVSRSPYSSDPTRRHFLAIVAAGTGRLSTLAASSALLAGCKGDQASTQQDQNKAGSQHHCFVRGSRILTVRGDVQVEDLSPGDWVVTADAAAQVEWIGRRVLRKDRSASWSEDATPIRVSPFAIDGQSPQRDLYLSPEHALLIDGALIPVKYLINGDTIKFDDEADNADTLEYFSIKLDRHDVIYAEGASAETFLYTGGQPRWDNLLEYKQTYGTELAPMKPFAPVLRYSGGRAEMAGLLRLAVSHFVDVRDPIQIARDRIAARAMSASAHAASWAMARDADSRGDASRRP